MSRIRTCSQFPTLQITKCIYLRW